MRLRTWIRLLFGPEALIGWAVAFYRPIWRLIELSGDVDFIVTYARYIGHFLRTDYGTIAVPIIGVLLVGHSAHRASRRNLEESPKITIDSASQRRLLRILNKYKGDNYNTDIEFSSVPQKPLAESLASIFRLANWRVNFLDYPRENQVPDYWEGVHVWGRNKHLVESVAAAFNKAGIKGVYSSVKQNPINPSNPKWKTVEHEVKIRIGHRSL